MDAMGNSTGALSDAYAEYYDSIQAKVDSFKASYQSLSQTIVNADLAKGLVGGAAKLLDFLTNIVSALDSIGGLAPMLVGFVSSIFASALPKILGGFKSLPKISTGILNIISAVKGIRFLFSGAAGPAVDIIGLLTNPSSVLAIGAAITALAFGIGKVVSLIKEAHPSVKELKQDLADIEATSESLQAERVKNKERIDELQDLKSSSGISQVEQQELSYLTQQNSLLSQQIQMQERLAELKRQAIATTSKTEAKDWLNSGWYQDKSGNTVVKTEHLEGYGGLLYAIGMYKDAKKEFDEAANDDARAKANNKMVAAAQDITKYTNEAANLRSSIVDSQSEEAIQLDHVINQANETLGIFTHSYKDFEEAFNDLSPDTLKEFGDSAELTAEQVKSLADNNKELKEWMDETGYSAEDVAIYFNRMRAETADTSAGVEELTDDVTNLSGELGKAAKDLEAYASATSGEKGDVADKYGSAYKKFLEDWNSGKTGSNAVQAAVELFIPEETLRDLDYDLTAAGELLASDMYQAIFNTDGDYGENFANYIKDNVEKFADVASIIDNGDGTFDFAYESLSGLAEAFGLSENAVTALLDCLDKYGVQTMMSAEDTRNLATELGLIGPNANTAASNVERVMTAISGLAQQGKSGTEIKSILNSLSSAGYINLDGIDGIGDAIADAVAAVQDADEETATFEITADDKATSVIDNAVATLKGADGQSATMYLYTSESAVGGDSGGSGYAGGHAARASGGSVPGGGKTLVNELGPEIISEDGQAYIAGGGRPTIVDLSPGAIVLDAETSKKAMRGGTFKGIPIRAAAYAINADVGGGGSSKTTKKLTDTGTYPSAVKTSATTVRCPRCGTQTPANRSTCVACGWDISRPYSSNYTADKGVSKNATGYTNPSAATIPTGGSGKGSGGGGQGGGGSGSSSSSKEETWFEKELAEHKHLVAMDKESQQNYLNWLDDAYKRAYNEGIIDLKEYRSKEEEVYNGRQNDFKDHLNDTEHLIELEENGENNPTTIYNLYVQMMGDIEKELKKCYADGLDATNDYVQYLQNTWIKYNDASKKQQEEANDEAKKQVKDLVDYRIKMLKQYLKNEIQNLKDRLSNLKEFNSKQKELLQELRNEENYLDDQSEKRKAVTDIQAELKQLESDTSAWAQKRKLKLQEELAEAQKTLDDFEKDHALKVAQDQLDAVYEAQEKSINAEVDALQDKLDNPEYLYETALNDVRNNSVALYEEMIEYNAKYGTGIRNDIVELWQEAYISLRRYHDLYSEYYNGINLVNATGYVPDSGYNKIVVAKKGYASGTSNATPGLHRIDEMGAEAVFASKNGNRYRMLSSGDKVLTADATNFLYNFAENGRRILAQLFSGTGAPSLGLVGAGGGITEIRTGDIIIQGNADERTVSEIRRAQREGINTILKEFNRLRK